MICKQKAIFSSLVEFLSELRITMAEMPHAAMGPPDCTKCKRGYMAPVTTAPMTGINDPLGMMPIFESMTLPTTLRCTRCAHEEEICIPSSELASTQP